MKLFDFDITSEDLDELIDKFASKGFFGYGKVTVSFQEAPIILFLETPSEYFNEFLNIKNYIINDNFVRDYVVYVYDKQRSIPDAKLYKFRVIHSYKSILFGITHRDSTKNV